MRESPFLFGNKKKKGEALSKQTYEENPQKCQPFGRENPFLRK